MPALPTIPREREAVAPIREQAAIDPALVDLVLRDRLAAKANELRRTRGGEFMQNWLDAERIICPDFFATAPAPPHVDEGHHEGHPR